MKMTKRQKQKLTKLVLSVVVLLIGLLVYRLVDPSGFQERWNEWLGIEESSQESVSIADNGNFSVHMIDVGIGDALLVQCDGKNMLIDAAENDAGDRVLSYLASQGVEKLDIAVGTHAHSDHIGGLDTVLSKIPCDRVYLSDMAEEATPTTKTYLDLLTVISEKKIPVTKAEAGKSFYLGSAKVEILGPRELYDDLNETSIVLKVTYGSTKFLFTGDMESGAEKDLIDAGCDLSADVLKVGHHGSSTSTSKRFLNAVSPSIALISVDEDNEYGHPHSEIMKRLQNADVEIYITRDAGSIVVVSDGKKIAVRTEK